MKRTPFLIEIRISGDSGEPVVQRLVAALRAFAELDVSAEEHVDAPGGSVNGYPQAALRAPARERILREAVEEARAAHRNLGYAAGVAAGKGAAITAKALGDWVRRRGVEPPRRRCFAPEHYEMMKVRAARARAVRAARRALAKEAPAPECSTLETPP